MSTSRLFTIPHSSQHLLSRTMGFALATLTLTSVHHIYGAYVYATPWRLHAAYVSAFAAAAIVGSRLVLRRRSAQVARRIALGVFALVTVTVAVLLIGLFEGADNHVLKNTLYFARVSTELMGRLFPAPTYEMPNDVFFEITGILQVVPAAFSALFLHRLTCVGGETQGKLRPGDVIAPRALTSIWGGMIGLPHPDRLVHLQFRRFAGCPVCNLHLRWFPIVRAVLFGLADVVRGKRPIPPMRPTGGSLGLPADLLIASDGRVIASKYGVHADDQWSVDELLQLALMERRTEPLRGTSPDSLLSLLILGRNRRRATTRPLQQAR